MIPLSCFVDYDLVGCFDYCIGLSHAEQNDVCNKLIQTLSLSLIFKPDKKLIFIIPM